MTVNGNGPTKHREWVAHIGPRHLVLGQKHRLEAGRCEEGSRETGAPRLALLLLTRETQRLEGKIRVLDATSAGTFVAAPHALGAGMGTANAQLAEQEAAVASREAHHGVGTHHGGTHGVQCQLSTTWRSGQNVTSSCWNL